MTKWLGWGSLAGMALMVFWIFGLTPDDANMGFSQKILYIHVPSVLAAYLAGAIVVYGSVGYLWKRRPEHDRLAKCAAELAVVFFGLGLVTGSIWGRPTWGTYWVWDARLTTTLLAFLIYVGYAVLRAFAPPGEKQARLAAVLGIIAFADIPLIHVSVQWWRTLHQPTTMFAVDETGKPKPAADPALFYPWLGALAVMALFFAFLLMYRLKVEAQQEAMEEQMAHQQ